MSAYRLAAEQYDPGVPTPVGYVGVVQSWSGWELTLQDPPVEHIEPGTRLVVAESLRVSDPFDGALVVKSINGKIITTVDHPMHCVPRMGVLDILLIHPCELADQEIVVRCECGRHEVRLKRETVEHLRDGNGVTR